MSQAMISTHGRQSSQLQSLPMTPLGSGLVTNQHVSYPFAPNMHVNLKQEQKEVTGKPAQILNSPHGSIGQLAPGVQLSQQMVQSIASQDLKKLAMQMQPTNVSGGSLTNIVHPQRQPLDQPNVQPNPLRNIARGISMLPQEQMILNQQGLGFNQQQQESHKYQMLVVQQDNVTKMHNGHPGAQNSQHGITVGLQSTSKMHEQEALNEHIKMEPQPVAISQQNSLFCTSLKLLVLAPTLRTTNYPYII
ncbi:unnamed protein product [Urochloa humidicola]